MTLEGARGVGVGGGDDQHLPDMSPVSTAMQTYLTWESPLSA